MSRRGLRACLVCAVVQQSSKFNLVGCPNCEEFLELRGNYDGIMDCTSAVFEGLITVNQTEDQRKSWVAKWQRLVGVKPGVYAVKVVGVLPDDYIAAVENSGNSYAPRDGSNSEDYRQ